jgi:D-sedoheptulose 7-phosphate isomerase
MKPNPAQSLTGLWDGAGELLRTHLLTSIETKQRVLENCEADILAAAARIASSLRDGGKLLLCGNGGSAADCQHIAAELVIRLTQDFVRPGLPAIALTTDSSMLTASANDFGFARVFERQVQALGRPGDVLVAISTSGNSENTLCALNYASAHGIHTIALTGSSGGKMARVAEIAIRIPSESTQHVQEAHIAVGHILCAIIERSLFPEAL